MTDKRIVLIVALGVIAVAVIATTGMVVLSFQGKDTSTLATIVGMALTGLAGALPGVRSGPSPGDPPTPVRVTNSPALPIPTHETEAEP